MRRAVLPVALAALLGCTADAASVAPADPRDDVHDAHDAHGGGDAHDPDDPGCETSCARPEHGVDRLTEAEFGRLLDAWQDGPMAEPTLALESLLFYGEQTRDYLAGVPLRADRRAFLLLELAKSRASIEMRLVDDDGAVRGTLTDHELVLGQGRHVAMHGDGGLGEIEVSGRVKRVGLKHVWSRW